MTLLLKNTYVPLLFINEGLWEEFVFLLRPFLISAVRSHVIDGKERGNFL